MQLARIHACMAVCVYPHSIADGMPIPKTIPIRTDTSGSADLTTLANATDPAPVCARV